MLLITSLICGLFMIDSAKAFIQANPAVYYIGYVLAIIALCALVCSKNLATKYPTNIILLVFFVFI